MKQEEAPIWLDFWMLYCTDIWRLILFNDVLFNKTEHGYMSCDADLVINGYFSILNSHECHIWFKRNHAF